MLPGPDDVARWIQRRHRPWWHVWYGRATREYWAMPAWAPDRHGLLAATTPEALDAAIATFEAHHPRPAHALDT